MVIGNPPFVGHRRIIAELSDNYTMARRKVYSASNIDLAFQRIRPIGAFLVAAQIAKDWITAPLNPNGDRDRNHPNFSTSRKIP